MIRIDTPFLVGNRQVGAPRCFRGRLAAHLMADTEEELMAYAVGVLGMKPEWVQYAGTFRVHFDLTGSRLRKAMQDHNVLKMTPKEMARWYLSRRPENNTCAPR